MSNLRRQSLFLHTWIAITIIATLFLMSAIGSGALAWVAKSDAEAINTAGSIRMATYRISFQLATDFADNHPFSSSLNIKQDGLDSDNAPQVEKQDRLDFSNKSESEKIDILVEDMESRLNKLQAYQLTSANRDKAISDQWSQIKSQWFRDLKPALLAQDKQGFYSDSTKYIDDVNRFVGALQDRNEQRQTWQQNLQILSLILSMIIMLIGVRRLQNSVLTPIQQLIKANRAFKEGKYDTRVSISGYREFEALGNSFNGMASTIERYQRSLESEVQTKTQHLVKANQALSLFYDFSKQLTSSPVSLHRLDELITGFGCIFPYLDFTLCIQSNILTNKNSIALHDDRMKELCTKLTCESCSIKEDVYTKTFPIIHQDIEFGELKVRPKSVLMTNKAYAEDEKKSEEDSTRIKVVEVDSSYLIAKNNELIVVLTNLVSTALSLRRQRQQDHQLILLEERSTIARELHDSLAQSLSYLKIQVSVLEKHLQLSADKDSGLVVFDEQSQIKVGQHISQIKMGLNSAYHELRDLLTTFRLTIDSGNFDEALYEAADEFAVKGQFDIKVNNQILSLNLTATEQVHLIQIIREALSNISRHAHANSVTIDLVYDDESNYVAMMVNDDGIGISGTVNQTQHHGLMIMKERAYKLGGDLIISNNVPAGTSVIVRFVPSFFTDYMAEQN